MESISSFFFLTVTLTVKILKNNKSNFCSAIKGIHTENWKREVSEIFMSNKEAVRTDGPVLFLAAPLRPQPNSPISLSSSCIFETERFLTQSQFSTLELLAGNREAKGTI